MSNSLILAGLGALLVLVPVLYAEELSGTTGRELLQFCHPSRTRHLGNSGIGAFYSHPDVDGVKVDFCLSNGSGCGKQAADAFCKRNGMRFAESYVVWTRAGLACGKTLMIGSGETCTGDCRGFRVISCAGKLFPGVINDVLNPPETPALDAAASSGSASVSEHQEAEETVENEEDGQEEEAPEEADNEEVGEDTEQTDETVEEVDEDTEETDENVEEVDEDTEQTDENVEEVGEDVTEADQDAEEHGEDVDEADEEPATKPEEPAVAQPQENTETESTTNNGEDVVTPAKEDQRDSTAGLEPLKLKPSAKDEQKAEEPSSGEKAAIKKTPEKPPEESTAVEIDHPGLGDVVLPGQAAPTPSQPPSAQDDETTPAPRRPPPSSGTPGLQDSIFCQERGAQSASAAARGGCGAVTTKCASAAALATAHETIRGRTGRRLQQQQVSNEECKTLFANECQAAAFDNATGLCAILMGSGPNAGEEKPGCESAEQAREIFKASVRESCDKFMAGAFP